jgi:type IV secretion system protein VirB11
VAANDTPETASTVPTTVPSKAAVVTDAMASTPIPSSKVPAAGPGALGWMLGALRPWLSDPAVTEWCLYRPGEAFVERARQWTRVSVPFATFEWCVRLAKLVGNATRQQVDADAPLLSAGLPGGERVQFALPPAAAPGHVAVRQHMEALPKVCTEREFISEMMVQATRLSDRAELALSSETLSRSR